MAPNRRPTLVFALGDARQRPAHWSHSTVSTAVCTVTVDLRPQSSKHETHYMINGPTSVARLAAMCEGAVFTSTWAHQMHWTIGSESDVSRMGLAEVGWLGRWGRGGRGVPGVLSHTPSLAQLVCVTHIGPSLLRADHTQVGQRQVNSWSMPKS